MTTETSSRSVGAVGLVEVSTPAWVGEEAQLSVAEEMMRKAGTRTIITMATALVELQYSTDVAVVVT